MNNYEIVSLILAKPESIAIYLIDGDITKEDLKTALEYIKEQKLLNPKEFKEKVKFLKDTSSLLITLQIAHNVGMSIDELHSALTKSAELVNEKHS